MVIEVKKTAEAVSKEDDVTLTHSSLFPVKPPKSSFFRNPITLAGALLLLLIVAVLLLISGIGNELKNPSETTAAPITDTPVTDAPISPSSRGLAPRHWPL